MAYSGIDDWRAALVPALQARTGAEVDAAAWDEGWDEDDFTLSWGEVEGDDDQIEIEEPEGSLMVPQGPKPPAKFDFALPNEPDPGWAQADRTAAMRGVNPGQRGGSGRLFNLARSFLGTPYVFGASGPSAFDCSGFVKYLFGRAYGVDLPHSAAQQSSATKKVGRDQLQPGDLIFYSYGRLGKGAIDHVEVYMGNGQQIGTSNTTEDLDIDAVDWDNVAVFGRVPGASGGRDPMLPKAESKMVATEAREDLASVPGRLTSSSSRDALSTALAGALTDDVVVTRERRWKTPKQFASQGPMGGIKAQLYRGFLDAGREDLARMVGTRDFNAWIKAESGWDPGVTSPANNHGKANDGLFQVWRGHEFNSRGQVSRMSPYEQAQIVAKYFSHLTPEAIRTYADEIRAGRYHGWG